MLMPAWRRPIEWLLLALLITALLTTFSRYARQVQGLGELAALKTTVGALRSALVIDHLQRQLAPASPAVPATGNPFDLLKQKPAAYLGALTEAQAAQAPDGAWFYVPSCPCVGYRPMDETWLESHSANPTLWFELTGWPGVLQLRPKENYLWGEESVS
jgi:hypothetical protein